MIRRLLCHGLWAGALCGAILMASSGQAAERQIVAEAEIVLQEIMAIPAKGIPRALLADAQGLVIVPGMIRGGFIIGAKHGRGIAVTRDDQGEWTNPVFIRVTGGNIGWQAGLQATDLILVFRNRTRIEEMMRGQFTLGANAGVAAGPVGRGMSAATDGQLRAEILSYSRSRGLFAGISIDGAVIRPDAQATDAFYGRRPGTGAGTVPPVATRFLQTLRGFSGAGTAEAAPAIPPVPHAHHERVCRQLRDAHERLEEILDPAWQTFLALPADFDASTPQALESVRQTVARYNQVAGDPQFRALAERQEFLETLTLLNRHAWLQEAAAGNVLPLPPPPATAR
ncbi:MAG: lipid-binding SYLF domain-containing protein [Pirellulales bacterium]